MIRAKMRCMERAQTYDNHIIYRFLPVIGRGDASEEDKSFWEATPGGEAQLMFQGRNKYWDENGDSPGEVPPDYKPGDYFYFDLTPNDDGNWTLHEKKDRGGQGEVDFKFWCKRKHHLEPKQKHSTLNLLVDNQRAFDLLGPPKEKWDLVITFAEPSDD